MSYGEFVRGEVSRATVWQAAFLKDRVVFYCFDLESEMGDEATIRTLFDPFVKPAPPGAFDESSVKCGNLGEVKAKEKIETARIAHQQAVASYASDCDAAEKKYWQEIMERAALKPETGRIVVIGVKSAGGIESFIDGDEPDILSSWWARWEDLSGRGAVFVGANSRDFDLPYLKIRSWINDIPVPPAAWDSYTERWHRSFRDVRREWLSGRRYSDCESSLNHMAKSLGVGEKMPGEIAAHFGKYWREDREKAVAYLRRDLDLTLAIARKAGIIPREKAA